MSGVSEEEELAVQSTSSSSLCPVCKKPFKTVLQHIKLSKKCREKVTSKQMEDLTEASEQNKKERDKLNRKRKKIEDPNKVKENAKRRKASERKKMDEEERKEKERRQKASQRSRIDSEKKKETERRHKASQRSRMDPEKRKETARQQKASERKRMDPDKRKQDARRWNDKHRLIENESDRLKMFLEDTLFGAVFICLCCQQKHFQTNTQVFTPKIREGIKIPLKDCIEKMKINYGSMTSPKLPQNEEDQFICKTCLGYMRRRKVPPTSVMNGLRLDQTDKQIEDEGLSMSELENSLIAPRIIFQKIFLLPKSRWSGMKDMQVNIPITSERINETLEKLPRTPQNAGLIGVKLKRKQEYKNSHKHQLINPQKLFLFIDKAKEMGNPYYKDVMTFETYRQACKKSHEDDLNLVFGDDTEPDEELNDENDISEEGASHVIDEFLMDALEPEFADDPDEELSKDDDEQLNEASKITAVTFQEESEVDTVQKFQFQYDDSVMMTDNYPEISVAPGEDQIPINMLYDKDWDVMAFPALHNIDGSNGKDQDREVKLTSQRYFIQRVTNVNSRFARCPAYLYAAVGFQEKMQINRNINLVGTRGKKLCSAEGKSKFELHDPYRALEAVPGTPKYWQKAKYEMLAKVDNFGAFNLFFTLSCGDTRWKPNFAAILLEKGYSIRYDVKRNTYGHWEQFIEGSIGDGEWKKFDEFMRDDVEESHHDLIRGNVVAATRYYDHRVKCFLRDVVMSKSNPMSAKYYTYKVEFQARGAGKYH